MQKKILFVLIFFCLSNFSFAQIKDTLLFKAVLTDLQLQEDKVKIDLVVDEILPFDVERTLFVIPEYANQFNEEDYFVFNAHIVMLTGTL